MNQWSSFQQGFALRGEFLFKRLKRNQKIAGDNAENILFSMAFSPDPLFTGAVWRRVGFSMGRKICCIDGNAPPWAEITDILRGLHDPPAGFMQRLKQRRFSMSGPPAPPDLPTMSGWRGVKQVLERRFSVRSAICLILHSRIIS